MLKVLVIVVMAFLIWGALSCQSSPSSEETQNSSSKIGVGSELLQPKQDPVPKEVPKRVEQAKAVKASSADLKLKDGFLPHAFPPIMPDTEFHKDSWSRNDCLNCHETGVHNAPLVRHEGMPDILLQAKCQTCHVFVPNSKPVARERENSRFSVNAFPPMIPASTAHSNAWNQDDCLLCHETGISKAPVVRHKGLPASYLTAKCRTCHVQVRSVEASQ